MKDVKQRYKMEMPEIVNYVGNQICRESVSDRGHVLCHYTYSHEANEKVGGPYAFNDIEAALHNVKEEP